MPAASSDRSSQQSWSFISEGSFAGGAPPAVSAAALDWDRFVQGEEDVYGLRVPRELRAQSTTPTDDVDDALIPSPRSRGNTAASNGNGKRQRTVTFEQTWVDSEAGLDNESVIPVAGRSSSAPPSIQLLQEAIRPSERRRAATAPPRGFFNHMLYGSLRSGASVELFSAPFCGLVFSAAASGFMTPFLANAFQPLLCVYLSFTDDQCDATLRFLKLPGVVSFFIGLLSDFYPLWSFHRKAYMLGGWICAYFMLMALVAIALVDDQAALLAPTVRTFYGGVVYVLLMLGTALGVTVATVAAFAFLVELSQREPIHERGSLVLQYLMTQEAATLLANVIIALVVGYDSEDDSTKAVVSMKVVLLIMAFVALVPIPAVLFRLDEEPRQIKVDAVDRSSLTRQLWSILQQEAVWRIILFICCSVFLASFQFDFADDAVLYWADASPDAERLGAIPRQVVLLLALLVFHFTLLNYSWIRISVAGLLLSVGVALLTALPTVFNGVRSAWYVMTLRSLAGVADAAVLLVTTLPLVEITENCLEGATTGLLSSYTVLIGMVILTFSDAVSTSSSALEKDFTHAVLAEDSSSTRWQVLAFLLANSAVNLLALAPILYLLPCQKLEAQQMRTYGNFSRPAGIAIAALFVALVLYAATVNLLALLNDTS